MFLLTANFRRFERKYGSGGLRVVAAEAGHVSENLILAATAHGHGARPTGGFYEPGLNALLGLDDDERFALAVVARRPAT